MHARTRAAFAIVSVLLGGCVATTPAVDNREATGAAHGGQWSDSASASTGGTDTGEHGPLPVIENRPPFPIDPTAFAPPEEDLEQTSIKLIDDAARERDTWARIREGLSLPDPIHPRALREAAWYGRHREYLARTVRRARPYLAYIVREVEKRGLPIEFTLLPIVESAFQPFAYSPAGAAGLWQFIPETGRRYGLKQNWWYDGRRDVVESTRAALDYLTKLLEDFDGDPLLAVAGYNWGEGHVIRAMARNRARGKPTDVWSLRLPRETRSHVSRLLAIAAVVKDPERFGVSLDPIPDRLHFQECLSTAKSTWPSLRISLESRSTRCTCSIPDTSAGPPIPTARTVCSSRAAPSSGSGSGLRNFQAATTRSGYATGSSTETRWPPSRSATGPA